MRKIVVICSMLLFGCQQVKKPETLKEKAFYDFDAVEYYKFNIGWDEINALGKPLPPAPPRLDGKPTVPARQYEPAAKEVSDLKLYKLYTQALPEHLDETAFEELISKTSTTKVSIDKKYFKKLRTEIFAEKNCEVPSIPSIMPVYTNVFVFKKDHKIIGTLQLDSSNFIHIFRGAKNKTDCFGFHGEIEELQKIIKIPLFHKTLAGK